MIRAPAIFLLLLVSPLMAATTTAKFTLNNSNWVDLGAGPLLLSFNGSGVYAISDTTPTLPKSEGFGIPNGKSAHIDTTSHVWAMAQGAPNVTAYVAAY